MSRPRRTPLYSSLVIAGLVLALAGGNAFAKKLTALEITKKAHEVEHYQGKDRRSKVTFTITDRGGNTRIRELTALRRDSRKGNGDQSYYLYFHKPADVSKMVFVVKKKSNGNDERSMYMPALDLLKRIGASDKRTSFVGSDYFYEDVSGRPIGEDTHKLVETTKNYYVLESKPKKKSSAEFTSYKRWIHKASFVTTKIQYFKKDKLYRHLIVEKVKDVQGYKTITRSTMETPGAGTKTTIEWEKNVYDIGIPKKVFSERYMRRKPVKYLK